MDNEHQQWQSSVMEIGTLVTVNDFKDAYLQMQFFPLQSQWALFKKMPLSK